MREVQNLLKINYCFKSQKLRYDSAPFDFVQLVEHCETFHTVVDIQDYHLVVGLHLK